MPEPTVRPATLDDVDFICQVIYLTDPGTESDADPNPEWLAVARGYTTDQVHGKEPDSITYVVEINGSRVGRLRVVRSAERHFIGGIQIHPAHQNQGIGTAVIDDLVREARAAGRPLELNVNKQNPNAERLYTRLGFRRRAEDGDDYIMTIR